MEIIKRGKLPSAGKAEWTCRNCKSKIRSKKYEGKLEHDQRDGDFVRCVCPVCSHENCIAVELYK